MKINNKGIFVAILAPVFTQLIWTSDWDRNSAVTLVLGLSEKTQWKTNPKSEVVLCVSKMTRMLRTIIIV